MYLNNILPTKRIKDITIENSFIKIKDSNDTKKEFLIESVGKVFLKSHGQNRYLFYFLIFIVLDSLFAYFISTIIAVLLIIILVISLYISKFSLMQKIYFLHIHNNVENSDYSISFNTNRKSEMLDIIWKIRRRKIEINL